MGAMLTSRTPVYEVGFVGDWNRPSGNMIQHTHPDTDRHVLRNTSRELHGKTVQLLERTQARQ